MLHNIIIKFVFDLLIFNDSICLNQKNFKKKNQKLSHLDSRYNLINLFIHTTAHTKNILFSFLLTSSLLKAWAQKKKTEITISDKRWRKRRRFGFSTIHLTYQHEWVRICFKTKTLIELMFIIAIKAQAVKHSSDKLCDLPH